MKGRPLVSIITPTYNHEKYIAECIESVLAQSYSSWEQIIVDDGSNDKTGDIIASYEDSRIKYFRQEHLGIWALGRAYNKALQASQGEFIAVLEGDDFWPTNKLELQIKALKGTDAVLSWGKAKIVDSQGNVLMVFPKDINHFTGMSKEQMVGKLLFENPIPSCTVVCRKSALLSVGGFKQPPGLPYVDMPTWLELSLIGEFLPVDDVLGCYRKHVRQVTSSMKASMIKASRYSIDFFNNLPEEVKTSVANTTNGLYEKLDRKAIEYYYYVGRANLKEGKRSEAKENFLKVIGRGHPTVKAKAMVGVVCSLCGIDMDWLDALSKRRILNDQK
jgi:glycosyltransferase involved in cell wall biosynthesis